MDPERSLAQALAQSPEPPSRARGNARLEEQRMQKHGKYRSSESPGSWCNWSLPRKRAWGARRSWKPTGSDGRRLRALGCILKSVGSHRWILSSDKAGLHTRNLSDCRVDDGFGGNGQAGDREANEESGRVRIYLALPQGVSK